MKVEKDEKGEKRREREVHKHERYHVREENQTNKFDCMHTALTHPHFKKPRHRASTVLESVQIKYCRIICQHNTFKQSRIRSDRPLHKPFDQLFDFFAANKVKERRTVQLVHSKVHKSQNQETQQIRCCKVPGTAVRWWHSVHRSFRHASVSVFCDPSGMHLSLYFVIPTACIHLCSLWSLRYASICAFDDPYSMHLSLHSIVPQVRFHLFKTGTAQSFHACWTLGHPRRHM